MVKSVSTKKQSRAKTVKSLGKTKAKSKAQVERGTIDLFDDVERSDVQFLLKGFKQSPQLVPWLASLMRDGVLEKTLQIQVAGAQPAQLGKNIGEKMKRWRNLPPRFWLLVWQNMWKQAPQEPDRKEEKWTLEMHQSLAEWAFRIHIAGGLPKTHKASGFEGPLLAVLKARHSECGSRLNDMTSQSFSENRYGYFFLPTPFIGIVGITSMELKVKVLSPEKAGEVNDWVLVGNTNKDAALVSKTLGYSQDLFILAERDIDNNLFKQNFPDHDLTFEFAHAADRFSDPKKYDADKSSLSAGGVGPSSGSGAASSSSVDPINVAKVGDIVITPLKKRRSLDAGSVAVPPQVKI